MLFDPSVKVSVAHPVVNVIWKSSVKEFWALVDLGSVTTILTLTVKICKGS